MLRVFDYWFRAEGLGWTRVASFGYRVPWFGLVAMSFGLRVKGGPGAAVTTVEGKPCFGFGVRVCGLGFRYKVWSLGCGVWGLGIGDWGVGCRVWG